MLADINRYGVNMEFLSLFMGNLLKKRGKVKMKFTKLIVLLAVVFSFLIVGCQNDSEAEKAGKKIGSLLDKAKDAVDDAKK